MPGKRMSQDVSDELTDCMLDIRRGIERVGEIVREYHLSTRIVLGEIRRDVERALDVSLIETLIKREG